MNLIQKDYLLFGEGLPPFDKIKIADIEPAILILLEEANNNLQILEEKATPSWKGLIEPLESVDKKLAWLWGIVNHLMGVKNNDELRKVYETLQPQIIKFYNKLNQSEKIYKTLKVLQNSSEFNGLSSAQKRIIEANVKSFELSGVGLESKERARFNEIQLELGELSNKFSNNVLDSTKAFSLILTSLDELAGLPESLLNLIVSEDKKSWKITLDAPCFIPFMQYSERADLREQVYKAYIKRASEGNFDNTEIINKILKLRFEEAELLGFENYAQLSLQNKMAQTTEQIKEKLCELLAKSKLVAEQELKQLNEFASKELKHWDLSFYTEKLRKELFDFSEEDLKPYFSFPLVLESLFSLANRLFEIDIIPADGQAPLWNDTVRFFRINRANTKETIAYFYLDPFVRPSEKRSGAWMDNCIDREVTSDGKIDLPVAYLICNQTPPLKDKPSLMTFLDVQTLFHEFGHGLQHMLTTINYKGASGINNVEWDAVELPSQFMENWCYEEKTIKSMAKHYETGEPLPDTLYQKLLKAKNYMSGLGMLRQLHFSILDLELHIQKSVNPFELRKELAKQTLLVQPLPEDAFLCSFGHIFAGGYSAGYYSYKWAEILSADAFAVFEEVGLDNEIELKKKGKLFRDTILSLGGSLEPMEVFKMFRGREPQTEALLKHNGLLSE